MGVVHAVGFEARRTLLTVLKASLAASQLPMLVACDLTGTEPGAPLPATCTVGCKGIGACRNQLVALAKSASASFLAVLDDDVVAPAGGLSALQAALRRDDTLDLVAGCYSAGDCYASTLEVDGRLMSFAPADLGNDPSMTTRVDVAHNLFVARVDALDAAPWAARAETMEHELFFTKWKLRGKTAAVLPSVVFNHNRNTETAAYTAKRHRETEFLQYTCKALPKLRGVVTSSYTLDCAGDASTVVLPQQTGLRLPLQWADGEAEEPAYPAMPVSTAVLALIPTQPLDHTVRARLRAGWLKHITDLSAFDYFFVTSSSTAAETMAYGDVLQIKLDAPDEYSRLGAKLHASYMYVLENLEFEFLLKCDADTYLKPMPLTAWLLANKCRTGYCGMLRVGETPARGASWWHVSEAQYGRPSFPPYITGGAYALGKAELKRLLAHADTVLPQIEDASTGLWAEAAGVAPQHTDRFRELPPHAELITDTMALALECCDKQVLAYHRPISMQVCEACDQPIETQRRHLSDTYSPSSPTHTSPAPPAPPPIETHASCVCDPTAPSPPPPSPPPPSPPPSPPLSAATFTTKASLKAAAQAFNDNQASAIATYGPIANWGVSSITNMSELFYSMTYFNADISGWDTSGVTTMQGMFQVRSARASTLTRIRPARCLLTARPTRVPSPGPQSPPPTPDTRQGASAFNQPLSLNTSSVTDMSSMFQVRSARAQPRDAQSGPRLHAACAVAAARPPASRPACRLAPYALLAALGRTRRISTSR